MERLEFLIRRYREIMPEPVRDWVEFPAPALEGWLVDDLCPVLEGYVKRPAFRDQATWPLRVLRPGAETAERQLVEATDAAIVACARAQRRVARRPAVRRHLESLSRRETSTPRPRHGNEEGQVRVETSISESVDELHLLVGQVEWIASHTWADLVCIEDYFEATGGWLEGGGPRGQAVEFVVALNPRLHPAGDFVSRCLCQRVETLCDILGRFRQVLPRPAGTVGENRMSAEEEAQEAYQTLTARAAELRQLCLQGDDQPLRDSCILLTQVYVAFQPQPDISWLGLPEPIVKLGAGTIRHRFMHPRNVELAERTAVALQELRRLYEDTNPLQSALEESVGGGGLVLVRHPPAVYWEGELIPVDWHRFPKCWQFLRRLAEKAQRSAVLEEKDLYGNKVVACSTLGTVFHRLKELLPASFWRHILPSRDPRGYRLELERHCLHVFPKPARDLPSTARE